MWKLIFNWPVPIRNNHAQVMTLPTAAIENGGGVNRQRHQTGQCRLFSHQLWRLRDEKHTTRELLGEKAGRWQGVRVLSLPSIRILYCRERKVVCWGQRATMSCSTSEEKKEKKMLRFFQSQLFLTFICWWFPSLHLFITLIIHQCLVLFGSKSLSTELAVGLSMTRLWTVFSPWCLDSFLQTDFMEHVTCLK